MVITVYIVARKKHILMSKATFNNEREKPLLELKKKLLINSQKHLAIFILLLKEH
jgi:hypothetical protein